MMKSLLCNLCLTIFFLPAFSQRTQPEAVAEAMSNTYNIYGDKLTGSCFMIVKNDKQYFITAAHLFKASHKSGDDVSVQLLVQNQLQTYQANVYFNSNRKVDVAVFTLPEKIVQNATIPAEYEKYREEFQKWFPGNGISTDSFFTTAGLDVYFLGFPLESLGTEFLGIKYPLVKKAVLSGWVKHNGIQLLLLDGHNNLGFSGGPVVAFDTAAKKMNVIGVISGYLPEPLDIKQKKETLSVNANSGIIICYETPYIDEIFASNKALTVR